MKNESISLEKTTIEEKRLVQYELLRVIAMFGVLMNHVFNYGLHIYDDFTLDVSYVGGFTLWSILELMKLAALPSVNCYILITGYFLVNSTHWRLKGILKVWSITWFYSVSIYLLAVAIGLCHFQWEEMFRHATPLYSNSYWFVTSYIALMFLAPLLSWGLQRLSQRQYLLVLILGFFICFQFFLGKYVMDNQQIVLFVYLFMIGGYIKRFHADSRRRPAFYAILSVFILMLMYCITVAKNYYFNRHDFYIYAMAYHGLVLPFSVTIFLFFKQLNIQGRNFQKSIYAIASLCFSVYIIHTQSVVDEILWKYAAKMFENCLLFMIPLLSVLLCITVYLICCAIDYFRVRIVRVLTEHLSTFDNI